LFLSLSCSSFSEKKDCCERILLSIATASLKQLFTALHSTTVLDLANIFVLPDRRSKEKPFFIRLRVRSECKLLHSPRNCSHRMENLLYVNSERNCAFMSRQWALPNSSRIPGDARVQGQNLLQQWIAYLYIT